jgi:predicted DsbA family dithiol-disulfide isomerase
MAHDAMHYTMRIAVLSALFVTIGMGATAPAPAVDVTPSHLFDGLAQAGDRLGDPKAPVVFYEFVDLRSPLSATYTRRLLPRLVRRYVRRGVVRMNLELLDFLGPVLQSKAAAGFAEATGEQDRLWNFADEFFLHQGLPSSPYATPQFLQSIAEEVPGLDAAAAARAASTSAVQEELGRASRLAARYRIEGVPTVVLTNRSGGRPVFLGLSSVREFESAIQQLLHAKRRNKSTATS